jgi:hypothetical protein
VRKQYLAFFRAVRNSQEAFWGYVEKDTYKISGSKD